MREASETIRVLRQGGREEAVDGVSEKKKKKKNLKKKKIGAIESRRTSPRSHRQDFDAFNE